VAAWLRGFTLIEMLVSLAVLALALAVVGVVFTITTKSASQAAAYSEALNYVRQFTQQIQEDLRYCDPAESVLVLVGRTQAAALTQSDLEAGKFHRVLIGNPANVPANYDPEYDTALDPGLNYSNPRADIVMFFSKRPTVSVAPNPDPEADPSFAGGVKFSPIRVVYGHAALAKPVLDGKQYRFPQVQLGEDWAFRHTEQTKLVGLRELSVIPASRWHLSRVATIVVPPLVSGSTQFSAVACESAGRCYRYWDASDPMPGDGAYLDLAEFLRNLGPSVATCSPYIYPLACWPPAVQDSINSVVYATHTAPPLYRHVATVLEDVPVELRSNLGVHMLPGCAWFQVEFLMPEDPRNSVDYVGDPNNPNMSTKADMPRWTIVPEGQTYVFVPDTPENREAVAAQVAAGNCHYPPLPGDDRLWDFARIDQCIGPTGFDPTTLHCRQSDAVAARRIRMWPYAIRITVHVYDPRGRLTEPIIRSIVHRFE